MEFSITKIVARSMTVSNPHFPIKISEQYLFNIKMWCGVYKNKTIAPPFHRKVVLYYTMNGQRHLHFSYVIHKTVLCAIVQ